MPNWCSWPRDVRQNVGSLGLENTEIAYTKAGITVDENMQTNVPGVYAIGDVNGKQMLAHAATFQGFRAVNHIVGHADRILFNIVPAAIFTHPEVGSVGLSEDQCKSRALLTNAARDIIVLMVKPMQATPPKA